jgi:hypothetical protein
MCFLFACLHADLQILEIDILNTGADPGWGTPGAPPLKLEKNMIFWREIVIFYTKYPKHFHASLRPRKFFKCAPPNL